MKCKCRLGPTGHLILMTVLLSLPPMPEMFPTLPFQVSPSQVVKSMKVDIFHHKPRHPKSFWKEHIGFEIASLSNSSGHLLPFSCKRLEQDNKTMVAGFLLRCAVSPEVHKSIYEPLPIGHQIFMQLVQFHLQERLRVGGKGLCPWSSRLLP